MSKSIVLPAGKYYIGDPCYVFTHDSWSPGICDAILDDREEHKGVKFFADHTAYGDGTYRGSNGFEYGVDAGLIGAIPFELITDLSGLEYGTVIEVNGELVCESNEGSFQIGDLVIDTADTGEEDDEDDFFDDDRDEYDK